MLGCVSLLVAGASGVPGSLDTSFVAPGTAYASALAVQPDGRIICARDTGYPTQTVIRLNTDGSLDEMFDAGPGAKAEGSVVPLHAVALQSDGRILVAGPFTNFSGTARARLARLESDGRIDNSFAGSANEGPSAIIVQPDNKVILAGGFDTVNGTSRPRIARLNADGSLDSTFAAFGESGASFYALALQRDGKVVAAGHYAGYYTGRTTHEPYVARFNTNGIVEFGPIGWASGADPFRYAYAVAVQSDGRIVVGGAFTNFRGAAVGNIARLNVNGSLDTTFQAGTGADDWVTSLLVQGDDKIYAAGYLTNFAGIPTRGIARLNHDGALDSTYRATNGPDSGVRDIAFQADGRLLVSGGFSTGIGSSYQGRLVRLLGDAEGVPVFTLPPSNQTVNAGVTATFSVVMSSFTPMGYQWQFNGESIPGRTSRLLRLTNVLSDHAGGYSVVVTNAFGAVTSAPAILTVVTSAPAILSPPTNTVADAGRSTFFSVIATGLPPPRFQWQFEGADILNATNSTLWIYYAETNDAGSYRVIAANPAGSVTSAPAILVVNTYPPGFTNQPQSQTVFVGRNVRLSAGLTAAPPAALQWRRDGIDIPGATVSTFGFTNIQPAHAGSYTLVASNALGTAESEGALLTVLPAPTGPGDVDVDFYPGSGADGAIHTIAVQPDGKLLLGGEFFRVSNVPRNRVARLNVDGSLDHTFVPTNIFGERVSAILPQSDGKVLFGGTVNRFDSTPLFGRLNPDGSADSAFMGANGLFQPVNGLAVQSDGQILAALTVPEDFAGPLVARFFPDGTRDWSLDAPVLNNFPAGNSVSPIPCYSVAVDDGDKLLLAWQSGFWRLLPAGGSDLTFARPRAAPPWNFSPKTVAVQADGRIIIGGLFTNLNGVPLGGLARLYADGSVDASFVPNLQPKNVNALQIQPDGKIIIGGGFTNVNGIARRRLARLNADGSLDTTFPDPDVRPGEVLAMTLTADCKLIIAGTFRDIGDVPRRGIARLHLDPMAAPVIVTPPASQTVTQGQTVSFYVETSCVPPGGYQWQFDGATLLGQTNSRMILQEASFSNAGSYTVIVSNSFGVTTSPPAELIVMAAPGHSGSLAGETVGDFGADGAVLAITHQADGKTLIGGRFTDVHGVARNDIARLHADGTVDLNFDIGSGVAGSGPVFVNALALQSDGKVVVAGRFLSVNGVDRTNIARLMPDGGVDSSFVAAVAQGPISALLVQGDGRIIIGGQFSYFSGSWYENVTRLNQNGSLDASFNPRPNFLVYALAQKLNGDIVMAGAAKIFSQEVLGIVSSNGIWRSFGITANRPVHGVSVLPDDTLLVAGAFTNLAGVSRSRVARLGTNGLVLSNVWQDVRISGDVRAILRLNCGKVVIGGVFTNINGTRRFGIARLNEDGSLDESYSPGSGTDGGVFVLSQHSDGRVMCGGEFSQINHSPRNCLARLKSDVFVPPTIYGPDSIVPGGSNVTFRVDAGCWPPASVFRWQLNGSEIDETFGASLTVTNFRFVNAGAYSVSISNRLGMATSPAFEMDVAQSVRAGAVDLDFFPPALSSNLSTRLALYEDGRILVALTTNAGFRGSRIERLHANGGFDSEFTPIKVSGEIRSLAVQSNAVIYVGGISTWLSRWYDGGTRLDQPVAFSSLGSINALLADLNGRILLGGEFVAQPSSVRNLARLHPSGTLDTNFLTSALSSDRINAIVQQTDRRILVAGAFTNFGGSSRRLIARVNSDGSLDPTFGIPVSVNATGSITSLTLQYDGKIVVGGPLRLDSPAGIRQRLARLHPDGNLDVSFDAGLQPDHSITALAAEPDGRIVIAGLFPCTSNSTCRVMRLNQDGSFDSSFDCFPGPDGPVTAMLRQPDGRVLISGDFKHVNGVPRHSIARLLGDLRIFDVTSSAAGWGCSVATIAGKAYRLESNDSLHDLSWTVRATASGNGEVVTLRDPTPNPVPRFYRIQME